MDIVSNDNSITDKPYLIPVSYVPTNIGSPITPTSDKNINPVTGREYLNPVSYVPVRNDAPMPIDKKKSRVYTPLKTPGYKGPSNPYLTQEQIMNEMAESAAGDLASEIGSLLLGLV